MSAGRWHGHARIRVLKQHSSSRRRLYSRITVKEQFSALVWWKRERGLVFLLTRGTIDHKRGGQGAWVLTKFRW